MTWIQTFKRREPTYPLALTPDQVHLEDIAHALALKCRWTGHTREFYSVAQHSVHVAELLPPHLQMAGLLHDAAEAYLPDVASPIKGRFAVLVPFGPILERLSMGRLEDRILGAVGRSLDMPELRHLTGLAATNHADLVMLVTEARDLMHGTEGWDRELPPPRPEPIEPWDWREAEQRFLLHFEVLRERAVRGPCPTTLRQMCGTRHHTDCLCSLDAGHDGPHVSGGLFWGVDMGREGGGGVSR